MIRIHESITSLGNGGKHHEIYLSNPSKTELSKLKAILRHPVKHNEE